MISLGTDDFHPVLFICLTKNIDGMIVKISGTRLVNWVSTRPYIPHPVTADGLLPPRKNYYVWIIVSIILNFVTACRA
jgi:hypothetical protein